MKKYIKPTLYVLLAAFVLGQFIRPEKNQSDDQSKHIRTQYPIPDEVESILKVACYDCHSNYTRYPWYAEVQPVAAWLDGHVRNGKRHLNFSDLTTRRIALQNHKMEEVVEVLEEGEMPLASYTLVHRDAILTEAQKKAVSDWALNVQAQIKAQYPPDSLRMRRGGGR